MRNRLIIQFLIPFVAVGVATFILIATLGSKLIYDQIISNESRRIYYEAIRISEARSNVRIQDEAALSDTREILRAVASYENARIFYISPQGEILIDTNSETDARPDIFLKSFDPLALGTDYYTVGRFFSFFDEDMLSVMMPLTNNMRTRGYLAIHVPMRELIARRESTLHIVLILFALFYFMFLGVLIWRLVILRKEVSALVSGVHKFAGGELTHEIDLKSQNELGLLASDLNYMANQLNKSGETQRNFISNVSHDFRSPLTSIKGYVEAILDGTIPEEMQEKYLGIVLAETKRLEKLTSGILTLNDINDKSTLLDLSDFDINRVIKDTAASFEGSCRARHISIELILHEQELFVKADHGKIQQVLYNLLDNAIKFSRDETTIRIETTIRHDKVFVSLRDHGIGIPANQINKIWDRFYKIDSSRGKDTRGTGLGLAIVKEIINAHKQTITVVSTEGAGTEFVFSLDLA